ncbi:MAG: hypothetical protein HY985_16915 [Magnetospirillum sp.]|nr:hypothetical protein [Magnetospirillum sp.]
MPARSDSGWVLLEVLAALAVLALAMAAVAEAVSLAAAAGSASARRDAAVLAARSLLEAAGSAAEDANGSLPDGLRWRRRIQRADPVPPPLGVPPLWQVTVTVSGAGRPVVVSTLKVGE